MLCQFSFKNYKSFKDEATLDFFAEPITENSDSLIIDKKDNEKFLPVAVIYGPNGGGKSTVLDAIYSLFATVLSFVLMFKFPQRQNLNLVNYENFYHKFDKNCKNKPTYFDILFRTENYEFNYQLSMIQNKIVEENLYYRNLDEKDEHVLFERNKNKLTKGELIEELPLNKVSETFPLLSHIAINYDINIIEEIINWFLKSDFINYNNPKQETRIILPDNKKELKEIFNLVKAMGININGARFEKNEKGEITKIFMIHPIDNGDSCEIALEDESAGTKKIFSFIYRMIKCLNCGGLLVIDELDAKLHPKLLRYAIELFTSKTTNRKNAQLVLTSHDISTMNSKIFRRDEIWFCALNPVNASTLYSLVSFKKEGGVKIRKDASYGKQYLEGRYGADPYLRKIIDWK